MSNVIVIDLHLVNGEVCTSDRGWGKVVFFYLKNGNYKTMINDYHQPIKRVGRLFKFKR